MAVTLTPVMPPLLVDHHRSGRIVRRLRHVAEMVRLLEDFLEEETDYVFYEIDGTVKVTPATLIGFLCKAMNEGSPLRKVVDEEVLL
jgi:hypothetical protein